MFDKIEKKIYEIRRQPEHIRLRYVWGAVALSMIFVIFIWIMSVKINFLKVQSDADTKRSLEGMQEQFQNIVPQQQSQGSVSIDDLLAPSPDSGPVRE
jgi:hypothetical protein